MSNPLNVIMGDSLVSSVSTVSFWFIPVKPETRGQTEKGTSKGIVILSGSFPYR